MEPLSRDHFSDLLRQARVKRRLVRELRFVPEAITDWSDRGFIAVSTRSGNEGVLVTYDTKCLPYTLSRRTNPSGRVAPITCDICMTWQRGTNSAILTFETHEGTISFLVCADLACSLHVRTITPEAVLSRAQLQEDLTNEDRIQRLRTRFNAMTEKVLV